MNRSIAGLVVEFIFDVEFDVWVLAEDIEGDQQQKGVDVRYILGKLQIDVNPTGSKESDEGETSG